MFQNFEPTCALPGTALTCLNGLKHNGTSLSLFVPGEQPEDFYNLLAESFETHKPSSTDDATLVTDFVVARWYLWRRQRAYNQSEHESYCAHAEEDTLNEADLRKLALFDRYRTQAERTFARALKNVQSIQKNVFNEEKWRVHHELQKAKFDLDRQKFELRQEQAALKKPQAAAAPPPESPAAEPSASSANDPVAELAKLSNFVIPSSPVGKIDVEEEATVVGEVKKDRLSFASAS